MISIGIVDDQPLIRAGLRMIVESQSDLVWVGEAGDGETAIALAEQQHPDIMLTDIRMPGLDGIGAIDGIRRASPWTRIVMLTTFDLDRYVYAALRAGASAFLLKDAGPEQILTAIRQVAQGDLLLAPALTRRLIEQYVARPQPDVGTRDPLRSLTDRERDVLICLAEGLSNAEIGSRLHVSEGTAKTHVSRILYKLGLRDRVQAVIAAYEAGLVIPGGRGGAEPPV